MLEIELTNRGDAPLSVAVDPRVAPGSPRLIPFDQWLFSTPKRTGAAAVDASRACWQNDEVVLHLLDENLVLDLRPGDCGGRLGRHRGHAARGASEVPSVLAAWADEAPAGGRRASGPLSATTYPW